MSNSIERFKQKVKRPSSVIEEAFAYLGSEISSDTNVDENVDVDVNATYEEQPTKRKKFEQAYTRQTYYIENSLLKQLNKVAGREKGEKTRIVNEALQQYLSK